MEVTIDKLVHGGQGLATLPDNRKVFVWGVLPGEKVTIRIIKSKKSYAEAIAEEIIEPSPNRISPKEQNYLATSPWQIIPLSKENEYKKAIVDELFTHEGIRIPSQWQMVAAENDWRYRNKMEYSFWGDEAGLHLALHRRGSHQKEIVTGSELAMPALDRAANDLVAALQTTDCRAGDLKTVVVRCDAKGEAVAALFVKPTEFVQLSLPSTLKGLRVYHSNPKSPASVPTELLYELGDCQLQDTLLGRTFTYDVDSFFQVNIPVFEQALERIKQECAGMPVIDMFGGVGSIGLSVAGSACTIIESHPATAAMARINAQQASDISAEVIESPSEKATEYLSANNVLIVDPPRAGMHTNLTAEILQVRPPKVVYLSCNPATQARDLALLQEAYDVSSFEGYNFFPHTPHIETLAICTRRTT